MQSTFVYVCIRVYVVLMDDGRKNRPHIESFAGPLSEAIYHQWTTRSNVHSKFFTCHPAINHPVFQENWLKNCMACWLVITRTYTYIARLNSKDYRTRFFMFLPKIGLTTPTVGTKEKHIKLIYHTAKRIQHCFSQIIYYSILCFYKLLNSLFYGLLLIHC